MRFVKSAELTHGQRNPFRPRNVLAAAAAMLLASLLVGCNDGNDKKQDDDKGTPSTSVESPSHKGGDPIWGGTTGTSDRTSDAPKSGNDDGETSDGVVNYVDWGKGTQAFGTADFGAITTGTPDRIPYGTKLIVTCYAPNNTGSYGSVNGLYRIKGGTWDGTFVPANVMLNDPKAQVGDTDTPSIDPRLKDVACK